MSQFAVRYLKKEISNLLFENIDLYYSDQLSFYVKLLSMMPFYKTTLNLDKDEVKIFQISIRFGVHQRHTTDCINRLKLFKKCCDHLLNLLIHQLGCKIGQMLRHLCRLFWRKILSINSLPITCRIPELHRFSKNVEKKVPECRFKRVILSMHLI